MKTIQNFRKRNLILFFVSIALLFSSCTNKDNNTGKQELEEYLQKEMQKQQIPGLTYAIVLNGKIMESGALGLANVGLKVPATLNSKFNIGSIGKTFTATSIMLLQKDGKLSINDPINKYFNSLPANWNSITIEHLLTHTSGIRDYCQDHPGYPLISRSTSGLFKHQHFCFGVACGKSDGEKIFGFSNRENLAAHGCFF